MIRFRLAFPQLAILVLALTCVAACQSQPADSSSAPVADLRAPEMLQAPVAKQFSLSYNRDVRVFGSLTPKDDVAVADFSLEVEYDRARGESVVGRVAPDERGRAEYQYRLEVSLSSSEPLEIAMEWSPPVRRMYTLAPKPGLTWAHVLQPSNAVEPNVVLTRIEGAGEEH